MITVSNVIFDEGNIVGNASFEDVLKAILPEEVYSDEEEEESETCAPRVVESEKDPPSKSPTSEASIGGMPVQVAAKMENLL